MPRTDVLNCNAGSDRTLQFNWDDGAGGNADLTGYSIDFFELHPALVGFLTIAITTPAVGLVTLNLTGDNGIPSGRVAYFRPRIISPGGFDTTSNRLWINIV